MIILEAEAKEMHGVLSGDHTLTSNVKGSSPLLGTDDLVTEGGRFRAPRRATLQHPLSLACRAAG